MLSYTQKNITKVIHNNQLNLNLGKSLLISRNFSKKELIGYSDAQIALTIKKIKSTDLVPQEFVGTQREEEVRANLLKTAIELKTFITNKEITKVQSIYKEIHIEKNSNYAIGQKSHLFSEIFSSVINKNAREYKYVYEFSSKGLSDLIKTRNEKTINVIVPPSAFITDSNSWKNSYEIVDAKKHASQKNLANDLTIVLSHDNSNSTFYKNELKDSIQVGDVPQQNSDAAYVFTSESGKVKNYKDYKRSMIHKTEQLDHESHQITAVGNVSNDIIWKYNEANCNKHLNTIELKREYGNLTEEEKLFYNKAEHHIQQFKLTQSESHLNELDKMGYPFRQFLNNDEIVS